MSDNNENNAFDAAAGSAPDGFMPGKPKEEPLETGGHKPGKLVGDAAPEFHVETLPAGTAPPDKTFQYQNDPDLPNPDAKAPKASDTLTGTSSSKTSS